MESRANGVNRHRTERTTTAPRLHALSIIFFPIGGARESLCLPNHPAGSVELGHGSAIFLIMKDDPARETPSPLKLEAVLYALSDPVRLHIVRNLADRGELACFAAVTGLELAKSTQSHHYRILREAGVIAQRKEGVCFITALRRTELDTRFPGLLDAVLSNMDSCDAAKAHAEQCGSPVEGRDPCG